MKSEFMLRALTLAEKARGRTSPNPLVGAVLIKNGKIIAEGFHEKAGKDHAEIVALKKAKGNAKGATLYVTLEPCCHHGKTPPCADAIIAAGVAKVVVATQDPNPLVAGKGIARLKKAGIPVMIGLLQKESQQLNEGWNKFITQKLPFVTLKAACSLDGKIAAEDGTSKWISNDLSRQKVHEMRAASDAVLVGVNTVLKDDPRLNVRLKKKDGVRHPLRVIVDTHLDTPPGAAVLHSFGGKVIIATASDNSRRAKALEEEGATVLRLPEKNKRVNLRELMAELGKRDVVNLMMEGGSELYSSALNEGIVDKLALFFAPILLGGGSYPVFGGAGVKSIASAIKISGMTVTPIGGDRLSKINGNFLIEGYINR